MEKEMELPIKIQLKKPLQYGNDTISELVFAREMIADDMRGISVDDIKHDDMLTLAGRLTETPPPVLKNLSMADYRATNKVIWSFLSDGQVIGDKL